MITDKLKELQTLRAKTAALEQQVAEERNQELAALPTEYGFDSAEEFINALRAATGARGARGRKSGSVSKGSRGRRRRAKITDETRAELKKMVEAGKTGAEIAGALGISLPSVQNIKKALGLVKEGKRAKKGK